MGGKLSDGHIYRASQHTYVTFAFVKIQEDAYFKPSDTRDHRQYYRARHAAVATFMADFHYFLAARMLVACPGTTATCICVTSGFRQVARRGIGWLGLQLVLKSPLWLAPVVYLAPLKPIIIIIIITKSF